MGRTQDSKLLERLASGDAGAAAELVARHWDGANRAYDWLRRRRARPELPLEEIDAVDPAAEDELASAIAERALGDELKRALLGLEEDFRVAVVLRHLLDCEYEEIAALVGAPAGTVRTRVHRGLARLRTALEQSRGEVIHEQAR